MCKAQQPHVDKQIEWRSLSIQSPVSPRIGIMLIAGVLAVGVILITVCKHRAGEWKRGRKRESYSAVTQSLEQQFLPINLPGERYVRLWCGGCGCICVRVCVGIFSPINPRVSVALCLSAPSPRVRICRRILETQIVCVPAHAY